MLTCGVLLFAYHAISNNNSKQYTALGHTYSVDDRFFIVSLGGMSVAVNENKADGVYNVPDSDVKVTVKDKKITAKWGLEEIPGYYETWVVWAAQNQNTGIVL